MTQPHISRYENDVMLYVAENRTTPGVHTPYWYSVSPFVLNVIRHLMGETSQDPDVILDAERVISWADQRPAGAYTPAPHFKDSL